MCAYSICARACRLLVIPVVLAAAAGCGGGGGATAPTALVGDTTAGLGTPAVTPVASPTTSGTPAVSTAVAFYTVRVLDADGQAGPLALNAAGQVAFTAVRPDGTHALFFDGTTVQTLGGAGSRAVAVNASGQVAGDARDGGSGPRAFIWTQPAPPLDLGTGIGNTSTAVAINASGQVAGSFTAGTQRPKAFVWTPGGRMVLRENLGGVTNVTATSEAVQLNDAGSVAGNASSPAGEMHAVQWGPAVRIRDLQGTFAGGDSAARAMNAAGDIVGERIDGASGRRMAFIAPASPGLARDLGTLGGNDSSAVAINDAVQVAGASQTVLGVAHAFFWEPAGGGVTHDLGTLGGLSSSAAAIAGDGTVCGTSRTATAADHAFIWRAGGGMVDLNDRLAGAPPGLVVSRCVALSNGAVLADSTAGLVLLQPR